MQNNTAIPDYSHLRATPLSQAEADQEREAQGQVSIAILVLVQPPFHSRQSAR